MKKEKVLIVMLVTILCIASFGLGYISSPTTTPSTILDISFIESESDINNDKDLFVVESGDYYLGRFNANKTKVFRFWSNMDWDDVTCYLVGKNYIRKHCFPILYFSSENKYVFADFTIRIPAEVGEYHVILDWKNNDSTVELQSYYIISDRIIVSWED